MPEFVGFRKMFGPENLNLTDLDEEQKVKLNDALFLAARRKEDEHILKLLVGYGADPNATREGVSPLFHAINNLEGFKFLLESGADPKIKDKAGNSLLHYLAATGTKIEIAQLLLDKGLDVNEENRHFETPLRGAISSVNYMMAEFLLANGGDDTRGPVCYTAILGRDEKMVKLLLEKNVNPNIRLGNNSPLYKALLSGDINLVNLLIEHGANLDFPLREAVEGGRPNNVEFLLDKGANPNCLNEDGKNLLDALEEGLKELSGKRFNPDEKINNILIASKKAQYEKIYKILREHGLSGTSF